MKSVGNTQSNSSG